MKVLPFFPNNYWALVTSFYLLFYNQGFLERLLSRALQRLRRVLSSIPHASNISLLFLRNRLFRTVTAEEGDEVLFSNYWMRLSRIWRILQVEESVIHRGRRQRWITPSEICRILPILRKPNSIIALLFIQNIIFAQTCNLLAAISLFVEWQSLVPRFSRSMVQ